MGTATKSKRQNKVSVTKQYKKRHGWTNMKKIPRAQCTKATARLVLEPVNRIQKTGTGKTFWKGKGKGTFRSDR